MTDENAAAGRRTGKYLAECGHVVVAAAMAAPVGRPCARCTAVWVAARSTTGPARRSRHRRPGWVWRMLHPGRSAGAVKTPAGRRSSSSAQFSAPGGQPDSSPGPDESRRKLSSRSGIHSQHSN
ncbi:MAG: hypothetical protein JO309_16785 [Pseudonocardiales bacterium]|nr:hypothetical protein [Pseudonocardiales bacterium]